jgi:hypothetical protein
MVGGGMVRGNMLVGGQIWVKPCPNDRPIAPIPYFHAMIKRSGDIDVVWDLLEATLAAQPASVFLQSLHYQYRERGSLSKKQLEGLYGKALKVKGIAPSKLATLQAIILKKHAKHRSEKPAIQPLLKKDERIGQLIDDILQQFPQHKRVLFFKNRYQHNEIITATERSELEKFYKLLLKKPLP